MQYGDYSCKRTMYNKDGTVKLKIAANGAITYYSYDALQNLTDVWNPMSVENGIIMYSRSSYEYDKAGKLVKEWTGVNLVTYSPEASSNPIPSEVFTKQYIYDDGLLVQETDYDGRSTTYAYDGAEYTYTYDGAGNLLRTEINGIVKSSAAYDLIGRAVSVTDGMGNTTYHKYNIFGKVSETITPGDSTIPSNRILYQYDVLGNLIYSKDGLGAVTGYTFDSFGRNLSVTISDETRDMEITTYTSYDLNGNMISEIDGNGNVTSYTYDALNHRITETNAKGQTTTYTYDANGNVITETNYLGNSTQMLYDGINRLIEKRDALGNIVEQIIYNDANAQIASYDALHNETRFHYDRNLRQTGITDGEGNTTSVAYDTRGNVISKTDGNNNTTRYRYDAENRLVSVIDALGNNTEYTYDINGNLTSQTDGNGNITIFRYNVANLPIERIDPAEAGANSGIERYTYYANGKMASKTDRNGVTTLYNYDVFGRLIFENAGGEVQEYTYDNNGNLLTMTDSTGATIRVYDELNRIITETVPGIGTSICEYDIPEEDGQYSKRTTDPKGNVTLRTYDRVGRLSAVTIGDKTTRYSYYNNGRKYRVTYPDGTKETYVYDRNNQITMLVNAREDGSVISSYEYSYDATGNQLTKTDEMGTTVYTYDRLNRLSTVTEPEGKQTEYTYDGAGNRKTEQVILTDGSMSNTIYAYDRQNRLTSTLSTGGIETRYIYDNNGNLISKYTSISKLASINGDITELPGFGLNIRRGNEAGTGTVDITLYTYDNYNRLTDMKTSDKEVYYRYNAQGYRVEKTVNGETTRYLYEYDKVVLETDENNNQKAFNVYGSNLLYRKVVSGSGAEEYYYLYNANGDVTALIDDEGNIAATYDYDAFGNIISETGNANNNIKYAGYQYDPESGLYYLNARYYDSTIARFLSEDTYRGQKDDPLSLNLYTYCCNNPIIYSDPSGHVVVPLDPVTTEKVIEIVYEGFKIIIIVIAGTVFGVTISRINNAPEDDYEGVRPTPCPAPSPPWEQNETGNSTHSISNAQEGSTPASPNNNKNNKKQLKNIGSNKQANKIAQENGYKNAEDFKESIVGKKNISKYNMKYDPKTGEIYLEAIKGGQQIPTGTYIR